MTDTVVTAPVEVKVKKTDITKARRAGILDQVREFFKDNEKSFAHTKVFKALFPDIPEGPDACEKWRDVGNALTALMNTGEITSDRPEGKARVVFTAVKKAEDPAPVEENTEPATEEEQAPEATDEVPAEETPADESTPESTEVIEE